MSHGYLHSEKCLLLSFLLACAFIAAADMTEGTSHSLRSATEERTAVEKTMKESEPSIRSQRRMESVCIDSRFESGEPWHDSYEQNNIDYTCDWYSKAESRCRKYGAKYSNEGMTANQACCTCGGGVGVQDTTALKKATTTSGSKQSKKSSKKSSKDEGEAYEVTFPPTKSPSANPTPSNVCNNLIVGGFQWNDSEGPEFDCNWYGNQDNCRGENCCEIYGDDNENNGFTANMACCECGGGIIESYQEPLQQAKSTCTDMTQSGGDKWYDDGGKKYDCKFYSRGDNCNHYGSKHKNFGLTGKDACCVCGGGNRPISKQAPKQNDDEVWLNEHNKVRQKFHKMHGYEPKDLKWDPKLKRSAQSYANFLIKRAVKEDRNADNCHLPHVLDGFPGGENLAAIRGPNPDSIDNVLYRWAGKEYFGNKDKIGMVEWRNDKPPGNMDFNIHGHFTQVVWMATTSVGCAYATKPGGICTIQVCRYEVAGNCGSPCGKKPCASNRNIPENDWKKWAYESKPRCTIPSSWWDNH